MNQRSILYWVLVAIAAATVLTGATQVIAPGFVLGTISAQIPPTTSHFFGIVGMFMVLFGGMTLHVLLGTATEPVALLWAGFQKFGASIAVGLGVSRGVFSSLGLLVACFDLLSGILILAYWNQVRRRA